MSILKKIFQSRISGAAWVQLALVLVLGATGAVTLAGCGGGGGGGGGGVVVGATVRLTLNDTSGVVVDGIVTLDGTSRATTSGVVEFADIAAGTKSVTLLVNGVSTLQNIVVSGSLVELTLVVPDSGPVSPTPTSPPPPPF